jgi:hypothetical protein
MWKVFSWMLGAGALTGYVVLAAGALGGYARTCLEMYQLRQEHRRRLVCAVTGLGLGAASHYKREALRKQLQSKRIAGSGGGLCTAEGKFIAQAEESLAALQELRREALVDVAPALIVGTAVALLVAGGLVITHGADLFGAAGDPFLVLGLGSLSLVAAVVGLPCVECMLAEVQRRIEERRLTREETPSRAAGAGGSAAQNLEQLTVASAYK